MENQSIENLEYFIDNSKKSIEQYQNVILTNDTRIKTISENLLVLGEVKKLLIKLKNSKMFEKKDFILNTINTALSDVFNDQNIRIDLEASNTNQEASKLNIKYDIVLYQNNIKMAKNEKLHDKNGGGVLSFISILFKILVGYIYSRNRFYVFDESLSEVSEIYLPRMGQFLQKFCKVHNFTIILITHAPAISEYADLAYSLDGEFEDGVPTLKIEKIVGTIPDKHYVYSHIKNFQSIKDLEFRYKGFTTIIGKNNIGKSASFRALNSIIFNNFDIKEYPRFKSSEEQDKLLNTRLEFGYFSEEGDPENDVKKIGFYKKGQSIIWFFDGMEFVGKNLASEKVKEKVEQIGFKYLKLKEQYKNFKGNLKEQTERLAITTQQDGYYLIGGKTSDTSKVFDFLFDSREVTLALIDLNNDIQNLESELNTLTNQNGELTFIISRTIKELARFQLQLKICIIQEIKHLNEIIEFNKEHLHTINNELILINKILDVADILWKIEYETNINSQLVSRQSYLTLFLEKLHAIITIGNKLMYIRNIIDSIRTNTYLKIKFEQLTKYKAILSINEFLESKKLNDGLNSRLQVVRHQVFILDKLITNCSHRMLIENIHNMSDKVDNLKTRSDFNYNKYNLLEKLIINATRLFNVSKMVEDIKNIKNYQQKLSDSIIYNNINLKLINNSIQRSKIEDTINLINNETKRIGTLKNHSDNLQTTLMNLPSSYGLVPCQICETLGYTHIH